MEEWLRLPSPEALTLGNLAQDTAKLEKRLAMALPQLSPITDLQGMTCDALQVLREMPSGTSRPITA